MWALPVVSRTVSRRNGVPLEVAPVGGFVLIKGDQDDFDLRELLLQGFQGGHFRKAGGAPAGPEVQENHLPAQIAQAHGVLAVVHGDQGSWRAELLWVAATIAPEGKRAAHGCRPDRQPRFPNSIASLLSYEAVRRASGSGSGSDGWAGNSERAAGPSYTPVLGLFAEGEERPTAKPAADPAERRPRAPLELSIVVPARNEEGNLRACLDTLVAQHEAVFPLGHEWEILVVDDDSIDRTRALAEEFAGKFPGVHVLRAPPLELRGDRRGLTGKTNACWAGAQAAQGRWLLFTDAGHAA